MSLHYTYFFTDPRDGSIFYVGKGFRWRMSKHVWQSSRGAHCNPKLQNKIRKLLELGFTVVPEKIFEHEDEWPCHAVEISAIAFYGLPNLCNLTYGGEGNFGRIVSPEARQKLSVAHKGKKLSKEHRAKMSLSRKGVFCHSLESRNKISSSLKGHKPSAEQLAKRSASLKGRTLSLEHRAKLAAAKIGKPGACLGRKYSPEHRAKISASKSGKNNPNFGKPRPPETRAKISAANKRRLIQE